jgi:cathepsin B
MRSLADLINDGSWGWRATADGPFAGRSFAELQRVVGGVLDAASRPADAVASAGGAAAPPSTVSSFDWRDQRPECIHAIRDQGKCGGCWAEAATEVLSDRLCLHTNGSVNIVVSPLDLLACSKKNRGCAGGYPDKAWEYIAASGLYADACIPWNLTDSLLCPLSRCTNGASPPQLLRDQPKYWVSKQPTYAVLGDLGAEIAAHGPVEAVFTVYEDFMQYESGIYTYVSGKSIGQHAVKILGWGEGTVVNASTNASTVVPYWIAANSWNVSWGEHGYFRIAKGQCGIDTACTAGKVRDYISERCKRELIRPSYSTLLACPPYFSRFAHDLLTTRRLPTCTRNTPCEPKVCLPGHPAVGCLHPNASATATTR